MFRVTGKPHLRSEGSQLSLLLLMLLLLDLLLLLELLDLLLLLLLVLFVPMQSACEIASSCSSGPPAGICDAVVSGIDEIFKSEAGKMCRRVSDQMMLVTHVCKGTQRTSNKYASC